MHNLFIRGGVLAIAALFSVGASAQDLVHEPISPTFGGNPFNSNHILGTANAQNKEKDPNAASSNSQADIFARQLQSRLLSSLSSQIVDAIFGENPQESGVVSFGGQTIEFFEGALDDGAAIVRTMPNTPAAVGRGITAAFANPHVDARQRALCQELLEAVGEVVWVDDEGLLDAVTAVSGSGPAYVFLLIECLAEAGVAVAGQSGDHGRGFGA